MDESFKRYKGYELSPAAYDGEQGFIPSLVIAKEHGPGRRERIFHPPVPEAAYKSKEEALVAAIMYGRRVIDGAERETVEGL